MANIPLQSITFPGLADKYTTPTVDNTLTQTGAAADAKKTGDEITGLKNDFTQLESAFVVETETGAIASFSDGADDVPVKDLQVAIEPVQSGSGDPSPENVRPISGWTGANVTVNNDVLSINWQTEAGTVYGGTLDVTTGVLTVNTRYVKSPTATAYGTSGVGVPYVDVALSGNNCGVNDGICISSDYKTIIIATTGMSGTVKLFDTAMTIYDSRFTSMSQATELLEGVEFVYELATPQTYQLTPQEVNTILGQNNIFADTGNVTVQYRADTKLYIDKVLSA